MRMTQNITTKACAPCRERKRKCDRLFPSCTLCYRLGRQCHYEASTRSYALSRESSAGTAHSLSVSPPNSEPVSLPSAFEDEESIESSVSAAITSQLSYAVGDIEGVRKIAVRYFSTIHLWYPILSQETFYGRLSNIFTQPCADYSLLALSLALITSMPSNSGSPSSLYTIVKASIAVSEAANIHSLEVVQSRLLVSLFEVGHGLATAAFISLGATTRAAVAIGLDQTAHNNCEENASILSSSEQGLRVWWAILMLDRTYSLSRGDGPCATQGLGSPRFLPRDKNALDQKVLASKVPLPLSTPSNIRVGPFARQAQVSHILGILTMHLHDSKNQEQLDLEESDQIARTLTAFSLLLPEETPQPWPRYCGAIGMCYSALMTLHESRRTATVITDQFHGPISFNSTLDRITLIATVFNRKFCQADVDSISPFPPDGICKAASTQYRLFKETGDSKRLEGANQLMRMMKHFSRRWMNAAKYLRSLEKQRDPEDLNYEILKKNEHIPNEATVQLANVF